jgi:hypothetical protein
VNDTHVGENIAWQARSIIAYARTLLAGCGEGGLTGHTGPYTQQLDEAEARILIDPSGARANAEAVLAAIEQVALPGGHAMDMVDVFVAQWRSYVALRNAQGEQAGIPPHNALLFVWEDRTAIPPERTLRIVTCLLDRGDAPPFTLPTQLQERKDDELIPWEQWRAEELRQVADTPWPVLHYLALYVNSETLCWDASPSFPLLDGVPDVRALIYEPSQWLTWPRPGLDSPADGLGSETEGPRSQGRPSTYISPLQGQDTLTIASSTLLPLTFRAIRAPQLWQRPGNGLPPYYEEAGDGADQDQAVRVFIHPSDGRSPLTPEEEAASYKAVLQLDDDKVRAFAICLGAWFAETSGGDPRLPKVRLDANAILAYQGVKQHERAYRRDQKEKVARDVWALSGIFLRGPQQVYDSRGRPKTVMVRSRLLEVEQEDEINLFGEEMPYAFRVAPASWIKPLLEDGTRYVATLLHPVLRYKPHQGVEKIAMRLGLHLALHWRFRAAHGNYEQPWYIRTLLDSTGIQIPTHRESRRRLMEDFERALDQLQADDVIASWEYGKFAENENPHRVFAEWLTRTVVVTPPSKVIQQYAELAPRRRLEIAAAKRRRKTSRDH